MAGRLSFQMGLDGTPKAVSDLKSFEGAINRVSDAVRRLMQQMKPDTLNRFLQANKGIRDSLAAEFIGRAKSGPAWASMGGQEFPIQKYADKFGAAQRQMRQAMAELKPALKDWQRDLQKAFTGMQWNFPRTAQNPIRLASDRMLAGGAARALAMGPLFAPPINWKMAAMGAMASPFSPWIGARALSSSGLFSKFGAGGNGAGGLFGHLVGPGGFGGFTAAFIAVNAAIRALKFTLEQFTEAVKRGSDLYLKSAMLGTSVGQFSHLSKVFTALGLPAASAERLMASGQFMRGQRMSVQDMIIGSGRGVLSHEEMQGIFNLAKDIDLLWRQTANAARQSASASRQLFLEHQMWTRIKIEWQALMEQMSASLAPLAEIIGGLALGFLQLMNHLKELEAFLKGGWVWRLMPESMRKDMLDLLSKMGKPGEVLRHWFELMGIIPSTANQKFGGQGLAGNFNSWQRMGFVMNGVGQTDYAKQIASNTAKLVSLIERYGYGAFPTTVRASAPQSYDTLFNRP